MFSEPTWLWILAGIIGIVYAYIVIKSTKEFNAEQSEKEVK